MRKKSLLIILLISFASLGSIAFAENTGFITTDGDNFDWEGEDFYFSSSNQYYLAYKSKVMITEVLQDARDLGMKVFRTWGFSEANWKDGFCFQPEPGVYNNRTFKKMDYIINKANNYGIRLIIPLVNNWDDDFGGMMQYAAWSASAKANFKFDVYNPASQVLALTVAISTGDSWMWHESLTKQINAGWNTVVFDLSSSTWKTAASGWANNVPITDLDKVKRINVLVTGYTSSGSVYLDNIKLGPSGHDILWDIAEEIGDWKAETGWSDATGIDVSEDYVTEGDKSLKFDFDPTGGNGKAIVFLDTNMGNHDAFYVDDTCKTLYKNYVSYFLNRTNTINGIKYKNDPTIMIWELTNEPRCKTDPSGNTLQVWMEEMAAYFKSIDSNHLVSTGSEGWYGVDGVDYITNNQIANIDACSIHMFPDDNYLSEKDAEEWITKRIDDAKNIIGKPVYVGEFGKKVDRDASRTNELVLHDFIANNESWYNHWGYDGDPVQVNNPYYNASGAIEFSVNMVHGDNAAGAVWYDTAKDLSAYDYIAGWMRTPDVPDGTWLELQLYTKSDAGDVETWSSEAIKGYLRSEEWYQVRLPVAEIISSGGDPTQVKSIGAQIKSFNSSYSGKVYYDLFEAYSGSNSSFATQMEVRNRLYQRWYNLIDQHDGDGGGFWLLSGHQEDGTLYPDYDHYAVYCPEDTDTNAIIKDFSEKMTEKIGNHAPELRQIGDKLVDEKSVLAFKIKADDLDEDILTYSASNLPPGSRFNPITRRFKWVPGFRRSGTYPDVHFEVTDGELIDSEDITIIVNNTNRAPKFNPRADREVDEGRVVTFRVKANDPDGDALTYSTGKLPAGATFDPAERRFRWRTTVGQAGLYKIKFVASDGDLACTLRVNITVNE